MEIRIQKTNLDDWFKDRTDYFNSSLSEINFSGARTFAYSHRPPMAMGDPSYIIVPENDCIREGTINLPVDVLARIQRIDLISAQNLLLEFRKAKLHFVLPEEYDQHYGNNKVFLDCADILRDNRGALIVMQSQPDPYTKGSLALARDYGIRII